VAVLHHLRAADGPLTAQQLADVLGVHHTAVRQHLSVLTDIGFVGPVPQPPQGRGRPKVAYRALADPEPYRHLALMLASAASAGITAREAGHRHGSAVPPDDGGGLATLQRETERIGFQPRLREGREGTSELVLGGCPFADIAAATPDTVCQLHRGYAEGIAEAAGDLRVLDLHIADPHRGGCRFVIAT
jgi:predicted ArsR family transcriptional regulator